jgi:hypothetical protein
VQLVPKWAKLNFAVLLIGDNFTISAEVAMGYKNEDCQTITGVR